MPEQKGSHTGIVDLFRTFRFYTHLSTAVFLSHRLIYMMTKVFFRHSLLKKLCYLEDLTFGESRKYDWVLH